MVGPSCALWVFSGSLASSTSPGVTTKKVTRPRASAVTQGRESSLLRGGGKTGCRLLWARPAWRR